MLDKIIDLEEYNFFLPEERIAQYPHEVRRFSRLMLIDRKQGDRSHCKFFDLPSLLDEGDLLVRNVSSVVPARLRGHKSTGGKIEILILSSDADSQSFRALIKTKGRLRPGITFNLAKQGNNSELAGSILKVFEGGEVLLKFDGEDPYSFGDVPLPPYIRNGVSESIDTERYQTIYAKIPGSVAAPTAGLHFDNILDTELRKAGVLIADVILHVASGTFRPITPKNLKDNVLHKEIFELPESTCELIEETKKRGKKVFAVGTTTCRVLESCARREEPLLPQSGETNLFIKPGDSFRVIDGLLTNFHLPRSSLLLLVAAFAGKEETLAAYREAIKEKYRFYSYGDAMLIK